jgi:hypothetical protein
MRIFLAFSKANHGTYDFMEAAAVMVVSMLVIMMMIVSMWARLFLFSFFVFMVVMVVMSMIFMCQNDYE